jgi:carboxylesterase
MRPLGEALAGRGFAVRAVRLPGHGTDPTDLAARRAPEWRAAAAAGLDALRAEVPYAAVAGMSMGALLALDLAATHPERVSALVLCGAPLRLPRVAWLPLFARVPGVARRWATIPKAAGGPDIADPAVRAASRSYRIMPLAAVLELIRLQRRVQREVGRVTTPALLLHGRLDRSVPLANLSLLRARLGSRWIETHVMERSAHVITLDYDRGEVARLAADFLERVEARLVTSGA